MRLGRIQGAVPRQCSQDRCWWRRLGRQADELGGRPSGGRSRRLAWAHRCQLSLGAPSRDRTCLCASAACSRGRNALLLRFPATGDAPNALVEANESLGAQHVLATTMDFFPTIASLSGAALPPGRTIDGKDLSPVLFSGAPTHHPHLFFSVGGESYGPHVPGGRACGDEPCSLFQAVRTPRWSAMFMVGYMGSCCRSPTTGDANTPYNRSCANQNASDPRLGVVTSRAWLRTPLLFDMLVDVAQAEPLQPGSPLHSQALLEIEAAVQWMNASLNDGQLRSQVKRGADLATAACCNRSNVVCRCDELPSPKGRHHSGPLLSGRSVPQDPI
eukprot:SAG11_NODE_2409_length_3396_cov_1.523506_4_plen_330_part_00